MSRCVDEMTKNYQKDKKTLTASFYISSGHLSEEAYMLSIGTDSEKNKLITELLSQIDNDNDKIIAKNILENMTFGDFLVRGY